MRKPMPFGKYLLLDRIAVGGMAEVFGAKAFGVEGFERIVAIKRILPNMVEDDEFIAMFIDEARIAALLNHANIATIYELGRHDETYFIAMEYVSGRDIRLLIDKFKKRGQTVPFPMAAYVLARIAEGLDYAHSRRDQDGRPLGIIHRDISPQNVLVSYDGDVKIIDFGIAKVSSRHQKTEAGILKGKFAYMSPEQVRGVPIDHRADLYSAGVMLYEMVTGTKLFSGESDFSTLEKVRAGTVRPPSDVNFRTPPDLEKILLKALAPDREDRYQSGAELHDDLMRYVFSEKDIFSAKNLATFMQDAFAEEFRKEQDRIRRWQDTSAEETPDFEPTRFSKTTTGPRKVRIGAPASEEARLKADEPTPLPGPFPKPDEVTGKITLPPVEPEPVSAPEDPPPADAANKVAPFAIEAKEKKETTAPLRKDPPAKAVEKTPPPKAPPPKPPSRAPVIAVVTLLVLGGVGALAWRQLNVAAPSVVITVRDAPKTVKVFVDDSLQSDGHPVVTLQSTKGEHRLHVEAPGYKAVDQTFTLTSGQASLEVSLVEVDSKPIETPTPTPVADVVDGGSGSQVARQSPPPKGSDTPRVVTAGGTPDAGSGPQVITMTGPDAGTPTPPVATKATLVVETTPPGAAFTVAGKNYKTPSTVPNLPVGQSVSVTFSLKGYESKQATQVITGTDDRLAVVLDAIAAAVPTPSPSTTPTPTPTPSATPHVVAEAKTLLNVVCYPGGKIFVDSKRVGSTKATTAFEMETTPGPHRVDCEADSGAKGSQEIIAVAGEIAKAKIRAQ